MAGHPDARALTSQPGAGAKLGAGWGGREPEAHSRRSPPAGGRPQQAANPSALTAGSSEPPD